MNPAKIYSQMIDDAHIDKTFPSSRWINDGMSSSSVECSDSEILDDNTSTLGLTTIYIAKGSICYIDDIFRKYAKLEKTRPFNPKYMDIQTSIKPNDRDSIVFWMLKTSVDLGLTNSTIFLAIKLFDYIISVKDISRDLLHLHGCACIFIAAKIEDEPCSTLCTRLVDHCTGITLGLLVEDELYIVQMLDFDISFATLVMYFRLFTQRITTLYPDIDQKVVYNTAVAVGIACILKETTSSMNTHDLALTIYAESLKQHGQTNQTYSGFDNDDNAEKYLIYTKSIVEDIANDRKSFINLDFGESYRKPLLAYIGIFES